MYELDTSTINDEDLKKRLEEWKSKILHWGHGFSEPHSTKEDFQWSIQQAKDFLLEIDSKVIGVETMKGQWE